MDLLKIATRVSGDVWDMKSHVFEQEAEDLAEEHGEDSIKSIIVECFDKSFGTNYNTDSDVPFFDSVENLNISDLFHELLHAAYNPSKLGAYESRLEGAIHEEAIRQYQESLGESSDFFETFLSFIDPEASYIKGMPDEMTEEEAREFLKRYVDDCARAEFPKTKPILADSARKMRAIVNHGGPDMLNRISKEAERLQTLGQEVAESIVPEDAETRIREWYRRLKIEFDKLAE